MCARLRVDSRVCGRLCVRASVAIQVTMDQQAASLSLLGSQVLLALKKADEAKFEVACMQQERARLPDRPPAQVRADGRCVCSSACYAAHVCQSYSSSHV